MVQPLDPSVESVSLLELTRLSALVAGAVAGAVVGWISKRNIFLSLYAFMLGIMGGLSIGTGMGHLFYMSADDVEARVSSGFHSILTALPAGLAGAVPTAFLMALIVAVLSLRHVKNRPPPKRTAWTGFFFGVAAGILTTVVMTVA